MGHRILFFIVFLTATISAQEVDENSPLSNYLEEPIPQRLFDRTAWEAAKEGIDYNESIRVDRRDENFESDTLSQSNTPINQGSGSKNSMGPLMTTLLYLLLIVAVIAIVAVIIAQFLGGDKIKFRRKRKVDTAALNFDIELVEEKLIESDLDRMIREAEETGNYPLALRLQYLAGVKSLATSHHIKWKKAKTNSQYFKEIADPKIKTQFLNNTLIYERICYGDAEITAELYQELKPIFKHFTKEVIRQPLTTNIEQDG